MYRSLLSVSGFTLISRVTGFMRDMIMANCTTDELREKARSFGMVTLRDAGMEAVFNGSTSAEEVIRETILDA